MDAFFKIMSCYHWVFLHWFLHCFIWISFGLDKPEFIYRNPWDGNLHLELSQVIYGGGTGLGGGDDCGSSFDGGDDSSGGFGGGGDGGGEYQTCCICLEKLICWR